MATKTVKGTTKRTRKTAQNLAQKTKKPEFNADIVRATQEKEAAKLQAFLEKQRKETLARFQKKTKERIAQIPEWIMLAVERSVKYGEQAKARVLSCMDNDLGLGYIKSKLDESVATETILEFEAVKAVITWATKKGFQYEISIRNGYWEFSIRNGYWELFLTW